MRAESARVPIRHTRSTALSHLPLRRLALCLDCEACFEIGASSCLACGGDTWVLLSKFLDQGPLKVLPQFHPFPKSWTAGSKGGRDDSHSQPAKQIFVVARDREKLFDYAKRAFSGNSSVEVVLDRRRGERRGTDKAGSPDRRRGDRRLMNEIDNHLRALGWAVVRLDVFRTLGLPHRSASR